MSPSGPFVFLAVEPNMAAKAKEHADRVMSLFKAETMSTCSGQVRVNGIIDILGAT